MIPWWFPLSLIAMPIIAGIFTPDRAYWFGGLCMTIPALLSRSVSDVLVGCLLAVFLDSNLTDSRPTETVWKRVYDSRWLWCVRLYFIYAFAPLYLPYVALVRLGMIIRKRAPKIARVAGSTVSTS